jgi:hypothetical protein
MRVASFLLCLIFAFAGPASARPGYCQVELINESHVDVTVHVTFDDGTSTHFIIHRLDSPHYIDLHHHGVCSHSQTTLVRVLDPRGAVLYSDRVRADSTLRILPH